MPPRALSHYGTKTVFGMPRSFLERLRYDHQGHGLGRRESRGLHSPFKGHADPSELSSRTLHCGTSAVVEGVEAAGGKSRKEGKTDSREESDGQQRPSLKANAGGRWDMFEKCESEYECEQRKPPRP
eukprot:1094393-Rhodomonas_salina.2